MLLGFLECDRNMILNSHPIAGKLLAVIEQSIEVCQGATL